MPIIFFPKLLKLTKPLIFFFAKKGKFSSLLILRILNNGKKAAGKSLLPNATHCFGYFQKAWTWVQWRITYEITGGSIKFLDVSRPFNQMWSWRLTLKMSERSLSVRLGNSNLIIICIIISSSQASFPVFSSRLNCVWEFTDNFFSKKSWCKHRHEGHK